MFDIKLTDKIIPKSIAIASGKGGVGKTWYAIHYAQALASHGKKVLLVDGDFGLANVNLQLGLIPQVTLKDALEGRVAIEQCIMNYRSAESDPFYILSGPSGLGHFEELTAAQWLYFKSELIKYAQLVDVIIFDLSPGLSSTVRKFLKMSESCDVIFSTEPTSLTDGYAVLKWLHRNYPALDKYTVINMANKVSAQTTFHNIRKTCESFLKFTPATKGYISWDANVPQSIKQQRPTFAINPNCKACDDLRKIVKYSLPHENINKLG